MLNLSINKKILFRGLELLKKRSNAFWVVLLATLLATASTIFCYVNDYIVRYGDSESHLNISKRVVDSLTPGFAQLGGIWLPLPHLLMVPFISIDALWRTGLAGSIVSGVAFVVAALYLYKTAYALTSYKPAAFIAALVFILNPNVLYLQTTPMTEILLIAFFSLSSFYFIRFLQGHNQLYSLLLAGFFGFCSVLTRYDGWFLVVLQAGCIFLYFFPWSKLPKNWAEIKGFFKTETWGRAEGYIVLFSTLAFMGIALWLIWDFLILGDALYFTHSEFSAKSQQNVWLARGELPAYHNLPLAFVYYFVTAMSNTGVLVFAAAIVGLFYFLFNKQEKNRFLIALVLSAPFAFNVITQFIGQSVIFIPHLTPVGFEWRLFNVRYGVMSVPLVGVLIGYLFFKSKVHMRLVIVGLIIAQIGLFLIGYSKVISWEDGIVGLSSAKRPDAESWLKDNYDFGYVLMDDYARTVSVVRSGVPMQNMIYIGNKPYWEESLHEPEKYARWIVMQENDSVWKAIWDNPEMQGRLYKYFEKVYTSPQILVFRKQRSVQTESLGWDIQCVDTMKFSRDAARDLAVTENLNEFVDSELSLVKGTGANCVSLGTPYDEEFVSYLKVWTDKAREKGLKVWFRGNVSGWEGWFNYPKLSGPEDHHKIVSALINKHPELFKDGDIFSPATEPENGILGDPRFSDENKQAFFKFLPASYENCVNSFRAIKISVTCGYFSVNGDIAKDIITKDLLVKIGDVIVVDHYVRDPDKFIADIQKLNQKFGVPVMIGEIGAPVPGIHGDMTDQQQAGYLSEILKRLYQHRDTVAGINYWVLRGGSTDLVDEAGSETKPGYTTLQNYFAPGIVTGKVTNTLGQPVTGVEVKLVKFNQQVKTNALGEYTITAPTERLTLEIQSADYLGQTKVTVASDPNKRTRQDFKVEPKHKNIWYRLRMWLNKN